MPINTLEPTPEQVKELRNLFTQKYTKSPPLAPFHPVDIARVKEDDLWCRRFLEMYDLDMSMAFEKLWETCIWRQQYGAYDLSEQNLRLEYLQCGLLFSHNKDKDGKPLLIFRTRLHTKGARDMDEIIRVLVYWIERIHRETNMDKITLVFDMSGTGLSNVDVDFVKRIIETFKMYYPNALNYILVYELAWILNAVFKIIKALLPAKAVEILRVIGQKDINTYIDKENCLTSWGGNDRYEFTFIPEANAGQVAAAKDDEENEPDKRVHFAQSSPPRASAMKAYEGDYTPLQHDMLRISPNEYIIFSRGDGSDSRVDITSISKFHVTFKIQTTSPEKFRVRPRCAVLKPGETVSVNILLKPDFQLAEGSRDKFLVMCMPAPEPNDMTMQQLNEIWKQKQISNSEVEQHRLQCIYKGALVETTRNGYAHSPMTQADSASKPPASMPDLMKHARQLEKQLRLTQVLQTLTLVFLLILAAAVIYLLYIQLSGAKVEDEPDVVNYGCPKGRHL